MCRLEINWNTFPGNMKNRQSGIDTKECNIHNHNVTIELRNAEEQEMDIRKLYSHFN